MLRSFCNLCVIPYLAGWLSPCPLQSTKTLPFTAWREGWLSPRGTSCSAIQLRSHFFVLLTCYRTWQTPVQLTKWKHLGPGYPDPRTQQWTRPLLRPINFKLLWWGFGNYFQRNSIYEMKDLKYSYPLWSLPLLCSLRAFMPDNTHGTGVGAVF